MAYITNQVEYGMHCLLWLADCGEIKPSSRELADIQGISPSFLAKIFPKLEKANLVTASKGIGGGYQLAKAPSAITVLDVVDAIEGKKPLFDCQEIRGRCALFAGDPPHWATNGVCSIHAVMLQAEQSMRDTLAATSLADLSRAVEDKAPGDFGREVHDWLQARVGTRKSKPPSAN